MRASSSCSATLPVRWEAELLTPWPPSAHIWGRAVRALLVGVVTGAERLERWKSRKVEATPLNQGLETLIQMSMKRRLSQSWHVISQFCIHVKYVATTKRKTHSNWQQKKHQWEPRLPRPMLYSGFAFVCRKKKLTQKRRRQDDQAGIPSCWSHEIIGWTFHWR